MGCIFSGKIHLSQADIGAVVAAVKLQQTVKGHLRLIIILQCGLADGSVEQQVPVLGHEVQSRIIILDGTGIITQVLTGDTAHLISINDKRIALDGHTSILLGTLVVLQTDFGDRTIEIRLSKKRLRLNGLVEILDGKDVILEVECITPDVHHLLGVDLGMYAKRYKQYQQQRQSPICHLYLIHLCNKITTKVGQNFSTAKKRLTDAHFFTFYRIKS